MCLYSVLTYSACVGEIETKGMCLHGCTCLEQRKNLNTEASPAKNKVVSEEVKPIQNQWNRMRENGWTLSLKFPVHRIVELMMWMTRWNRDSDDIVTDGEIAGTLRSEEVTADATKTTMKKRKKFLHIAIICKLWDLAMAWRVRQEECDPQQLLQVKRIRDLAARKRALVTKQKNYNWLHQVNL